MPTFWEYGNGNGNGNGIGHGNGNRSGEWNMAAVATPSIAIANDRSVGEGSGK